jgi:hypothetical protein
MTTPAAEKLYLAQHEYETEGMGYAVYNPHNKPISELPFIIGFNNGGSPGCYYGQLVAQDGTGLGGHLCSHEGYMKSDLGILEGSREDRHEGFIEHYPDGYRMRFVSFADVPADAMLQNAFKLNQEIAAKEKALES